MKKFFVKSIIFTLVTVSFITILFVSPNTLASAVHNQHNPNSLMGLHGMVLIRHSKEGLFVSHLPLYKAPHNYQIIYKIQLKEPETVFALMGEGMVTILPERFDLTRLISGERFTIKADVYQGHFERGGRVKFTTEVTFTKAILVAKVLPTFTQDSAIVYQVPLNKQNTIFAHKIQAPPSFDAVGFSDNINQGDSVEMRTCDRASGLNKQLIQEMLVSCQLIDVKYIETRDFK